MPALIVLVDADRKALRHTEMHLSEAGYLVAAVSTFREAKRLLDSVSPDLLITAVRLDSFNGLHLAVQSRIEHPLLPVMVTHSSLDLQLQMDAGRAGIMFIVKPLEHPQFLGRVKAAVEEHGQQQPPIRRWRRKQVGCVLEAELAAAPARVVDVSYGGMRLTFWDERMLPDVFDVTVPGAGLTVKARSVWKVRSTTTAEFCCGAEVIDSGTPEATGWRDFVDNA